MARTKEAIKAEREKEREAVKMWRAQCDGLLDNENFEYEWTTSHCFVTGTVYDGRRVTVQVGWDSKGAYVWGGYKYRFCEAHDNREHGSLVLEKA